MIQEYYLHLLCGTNGEHDQSTGAGRLAIAALMSGFGLTASTKKDLQSRVGWSVTPGCFLGQKEIQEDGYWVRNYPETQFAVKLMKFRKVNRTMNYQLDWSVLDDANTDWSATSSIWINLAKIYWLGYFLFGRNVIPDFVMEKLVSRWTPEVSNNQTQRQILKSHFVMQFLKNIGINFRRLAVPHIFDDGRDGLTRTQIFFSLAIAMNWSENAAGFFAAGAMIPELVPVGRSFDHFSDHVREYSDSRPGRFNGNYMPLTQQYYYTFGMGRPPIPTTPGRMPTYGRDILPLLFCDNSRTPEQERSANYSQVRGERINTEYLSHNLQTWMIGAILWEYHLFLTGRELFPLTLLSQARVEKAWELEYILGSIVHLTPTNQKNCTVGQIIRFNLERQLQV